MPFIDLNTRTFLQTGKEFDVTIIGAGAAGILLAVRLAKAGKKVLIIESGHFSIDEEKQKLNEVEQTGKPLTTYSWGRKRAIGGTTLAWGGQSLPFTAMDFKRRPWILNSGWPIDFETVETYYDEANAFMGIDLLNYKNDIFKRAKIKDPGINPAFIDFHVSKWAKEPNFQSLYKDFLNQNTTVLFNAHLLAIRKLNSAVNEIEICNFNKIKINLSVNVLIIAAGGIETNRILLTNKLGNHSGWLGKCFMEHPCIEIGEVFSKKPYSIQKTFNTHIWNNNKYSIRLSLSSRFQEENKILNCSASIMFKPPEDKFDPYAELAAMRKGFNLSSLIKISGSINDIAKSGWAYLKDKFYYKVNAKNKLVLMIEQEPITESCISLDDSQDLFAIPKGKISWQISYKTWQTVLKISEILIKEIERLGIGTVQLYDYITSSNSRWEDYLSDVNHHMGGCRMSSSAEEGVVDKDLQVWHIPNLYICSTAVFPTSSHSNPTLTLLALAARLSDHISNNN
jgi:choline dehydrogenase-like flavoprotein